MAEFARIVFFVVALLAIPAGISRVTGAFRLEKLLHLSGLYNGSSGRIRTVARDLFHDNRVAKTGIGGKLMSKGSLETS